MRILHVVPSYLPAVRYGGPVLSVHGLCKALAARGHEVHVFTTNVDGPGNSSVPLEVPVEMDGVKVWYFAVPALRRLYWSPGMHRALRAQVAGFDVVHTHSVFLWPTWAAARVSHVLDVPYVLAPRGMLVRALIQKKSRWLKLAWIRLIERGNIRNASLIHFTSRLEAEEAAALGLPIHDSCVVANGVDIPESEWELAIKSIQGSSISHGPYLFFLGRINWKKGLDRLIAAMPQIRGCSLVIAGNDEEDYQQELEALAEKAGVGHRLFFVGPAYGVEKLNLLRHARMLVLPSYSENFGNVVLEAMAAGCPVVVTPEVGAADLVRESRAGAVLAGDPATLSDGINRLLSDEAELRRAGERGRDFVSRNCTWDAVSIQMEAAYRQTIASMHAKGNG